MFCFFYNSEGWEDYFKRIVGMFYGRGSRFGMWGFKSKIRISRRELKGGRIYFILIRYRVYGILLLRKD